MPDFGTPFSGFASEQMYTQLADSIDHPLAQAVLKDVADEERVHAGQFLKLLYHLAPDEEKLYQKGAKEDEEILNKVKASSSS